MPARRRISLLSVGPPRVQHLLQRVQWRLIALALSSQQVELPEMPERFNQTRLSRLRICVTPAEARLPTGSAS